MTLELHYPTNWAYEGEVDVLKKQIIEMQPVLIQTSKEVSEMMEVIAKDKIDAGETQEIVAREEAMHAADEALAARGEAFGGCYGGIHAGRDVKDNLGAGMIPDAGVFDLFRCYVMADVKIRRRNPPG